MFSSVDFPQPDAPTMQTISPSPTSRSIPSMARTVFRRRVVKSLTTFSMHELLRRDSRSTCVMAEPTVRAVAQPAEREVADDADQPEDDEDREHAVDLAAALRLDQPIAEAVLRGEQLGDDEHQPRGREVDAGDVDDAGPRVREDDAAEHAECVPRRACTRWRSTRAARRARRRRSSGCCRRRCRR